MTKGLPDSAGPTLFRRKVYALTKRIPEGRVSTYGEIAKALQSSARAVGTALRHNPWAPMVPCHRVIRSDYSLGGFAGSTDPDSPELVRKVMILRDEGIAFEQKGTSLWLARNQRNVVIVKFSHPEKIEDQEILPESLSRPKSKIEA